ncbi:hypothetical protein B0J14DRAFT_562194 [Halenospora varia]|nr:hypothetical protein B0J14DRAFT_562194 [Halenospora varia]
MLLSSVQKIFTLVVFSSATVCCAVLGILLLRQDNIAKAGIATLTPLASEAQGATSVLATAIATAVNNAQSAAGAVATAATAAIEGSIPLNCSLGTKGFCVGFANHTQQCDKFPLNVSRIEVLVSTISNDWLMSDYTGELTQPSSSTISSFNDSELDAGQESLLDMSNSDPCTLASAASTRPSSMESTWSRNEHGPCYSRKTQPYFPVDGSEANIRRCVDVDATGEYEDYMDYLKEAIAAHSGP